ncbi:unnamed protein product, partial [Didymodactylos carnosus]
NQDYDQMLDFQQKILEIQLKSLDDNYQNLSVTYNKMSVIYYMKKDFQLALEYCTKALKIALPSLPVDHPFILKYREIFLLHSSSDDESKCGLIDTYRVLFEDNDKEHRTMQQFEHEYNSEIELFGLIPRTKIETIQLLSIEQYTQLNEKYPFSLTCPCFNISIPYEKFITQLKQRYHQLSSSKFITDEWIDYLNGIPPTKLYYRDFRRAAGHSFEFLSRSCQLSSQTISNELTKFQSRLLVTPYLLSEQTFQVQMQSLFGELQFSPRQTFIRALEFVRLTSRANGLMSTLMTNFGYLIKYLEVESVDGFTTY